MFIRCKILRCTLSVASKACIPCVRKRPKSRLFLACCFVDNRFVLGLQYPSQIVCSGLAVPLYKARGIPFPYAFLRVDVRVYLPNAVVPVDGDGPPLREIPEVHFERVVFAVEWGEHEKRVGFARPYAAARSPGYAAFLGRIPLGEMVCESYGGVQIRRQFSNSLSSFATSRALFRRNRRRACRRGRRQSVLCCFRGRSFLCAPLWRKTARRTREVRVRRTAG